jgi:hypothetical protein
VGASTLATLHEELADVESQLGLARAQEAVLKEAIRDLERQLAAARALAGGVSLTYLKNVVLQFMSFAGDPGAVSQRRALVLVLATMLQFDAAERKRVGCPPLSAPPLHAPAVALSAAQPPAIPAQKLVAPVPAGSGPGPAPASSSAFFSPLRPAGPAAVGGGNGLPAAVPAPAHVLAPAVAGAASAARGAVAQQQPPVSAGYGSFDDARGPGGGVVRGPNAAARSSDRDGVRIGFGGASVRVV